MKAGKALAISMPVALLLVLLTMPASQARFRKPLTPSWGSDKLQFLSPGSSSRAMSFVLQINGLPCVVEAVTLSSSSWAAQSRQLTHLRARGWEDITEEMAEKLQEIMEEEGIENPVFQVDPFQVLSMVRLLRKGNVIAILTVADTPEGAQVGFACLDADAEQIMEAFSRPSDPRQVPGIPLPMSNRPHLHIQGIGGVGNQAVFLQTSMGQDYVCQWQKERMEGLGWTATSMPSLGPSLPRLILFQRGGQNCLFAACRSESSGDSLVMILTGV